MVYNFCSNDFAGDMSLKKSWWKSKTPYIGKHKLDKRVFQFENPRKIVFDYLDDYYSVKIETDSEYKLLEQLNFDHEYFLIFAEHKILSIDEFEKIKAEAKATEIDCTVRTEQFKDGFCKSIDFPLFKFTL